MMTKFTFATQPRYDRTHGNITYSADSQPSRFSFNIRIVALYIKTHTEFQFTVRFNFQRVHVNLSIYIYIVTIVAKILKRTESRSSQNQSLFLTHPVHALFLFFSFFRFFSSTVLLFFVFFLSFFFFPSHVPSLFHWPARGRETELGSRSRQVGPRFGKPGVADLGGGNPFSTREKDDLQSSFSTPLVWLFFSLSLSLSLL